MLPVKLQTRLMPCSQIDILRLQDVENDHCQGNQPTTMEAGEPVIPALSYFRMTLLCKLSRNLCRSRSNKYYISSLSLV